MAGVDDPVSSPMALVQDYLRSKGLQSTSENVRRTLEQAARDPTFMPGLKTEEPPPADQRAPSSGGRSVADKIEGQGGSGSGTGRGLPTPPIPPADAIPADATSGQTATTSAQPGPSMSLGPAILASVPLLGAAGYGAYRAMRPGEVAPGASVPPPVDPGAAIAAQEPGRYNPEAFDPLQRPAPGWNAEGAVPDLGTPRSADPLSAAINRAVEPSAVGPSSPLAPMTPTAPGPGPDQTYLGNARPDTSTTLEPPPIPLNRRKVTIEEIPHTPATNFRTRPPMRLHVPG